MAAALRSRPSIAARTACPKKRFWILPRATPGVKNLTVKFPVLGRIRQAALLSPDTPGAAPLSPADVDGKTTLVIPSLTSYAVAVLDYQQLAPAPMAADVRVPVLGEWRRPRENSFTVGRDGLVAADELPNSYVQGRLHPDLRNNPLFVVDYRQAGTFMVEVDRVASMGARLTVSVDGRTVLEVDLAGKSCAGREGVEAVREFAAPIPPGKHQIQVDNPGPDWFSVRGYRLTGYGD